MLCYQQKPCVGFKEFPLRLEDAGFRPGSRATFVSAKVAKTILAMLWPFGFPARFADPGVAQTRKAQTMRAFSPGSAALLGHITRPGESAETKLF
ncbi:hypothetical protein PJI16_11895 [Nitrospira sp. MA-1]|nr:hypothetical protein [Nitrospira sp. MA-1]